MKITFLVVERSFLTSLRQAAAEIRDGQQIDLELAVHVLPDLKGDGAWQTIAADVSSSLAVFAVHVTDEAAAAQVGVALERALGSRLPLAFVPLNCTASLMRHVRLGKLDLAGQRGFMSAFGKLIRRPSGRRSAESFAAFAGRVSRWLRFAPGRGQEFRAYLQLYSYYLNSSPENLRSLLLFVLRRYGDLEVAVDPPREYPTASLYHPDAPRLFEELDDYLAWFFSRSQAPPPGAARVGIVLFRSFVLNRNTAHYDAVIRAVEKRGLLPVPALSFALDNRVVQNRY
ncbi:MAG TPA: cobaltochelatase subunit CobN, partial [Chloroflexota bacterium]|nr:cobaltochelatase subunit CobN [Chloroflexota bacterium]